MATFNVFDNVSGATKTITVDIDSSVVNGQHTGANAVFITVSINAKTPNDGTIPSIVLTDADMTGDVTSAVNAAIVELFRYAAGEAGYLDSTSSSSTDLESTSSRTQSSVTSGESNSSSSTRHQGSTSSCSTRSSNSSSIT